MPLVEILDGRVRRRALYAYRKVEVAGDRHRYRYQGPYGARPIRRHDGVEDLTGWDVLVMQKELHSDDPRKLWGSPIRVYAAPPGDPRPDPARPPEEQGWRELDEGGRLRRPRAPGTGAFFQERLVSQMAAGNPWVADHWRRLADRQSTAKDAEAERIEHEHGRMLQVARAARELRRLRPDAVLSWTGDPPFPARVTYVPMIGEVLATIRGLGEREWMALQDRVLLAVHPERELDDDNSPVYGFARVGVRRPAGHTPTGPGGRARAAGLGGAGGGASTSASTNAKPSVAAAGGIGARPWTPSQNGPDRVCIVAPLPGGRRLPPARLGGGGHGGLNGIMCASAC